MPNWSIKTGNSLDTTLEVDSLDLTDPPLWAKLSTSDYTVICGDALTEMGLMADGSVDAIITDPPYNEVNHASNGLRSLDKGSADSDSLDIEKVAAEMVRLTAGSIYVFCGFEQVSLWVREFKARKMIVRAGMWVKTNPSPMNGKHFWLSGVEFCVAAKKPRSYFNKHCKLPVWPGPTQRNVPWHPTPKPIWLLRDFIDASVPEGGVVLDPFAGSGSTGVACLDKGHKSILIDYVPLYASKMVERLEASKANQVEENTK